MLEAFFVLLKLATKIISTISKNTTFFRQPIFSQLINLLNKDKIDQIAQERNTDRYCKKFNTFQHLITMIYSVTSGCNSLRELCSKIVSYGDKIKHCKFNYSPRRSTVSDTNKRRDNHVFELIYDDLVKTYLPDLSDSPKQVVIDKKAYAIDSTTISLFQPVFEGVGRTPLNGRKKGRYKKSSKIRFTSGYPC